MLRMRCSHVEEQALRISQEPRSWMLPDLHSGIDSVRADLHANTTGRWCTASFNIGLD
jgi:hypothetical protein